MTIRGTPVGDLACQNDSFLKSLNTTVLSCEKATGVRDSWEIVLQDTVIFPEGGGQPSDTGRLKSTTSDITSDILHVFRRGLEAVHISSKPFEPGSCVLVEIDWQRRHDHMQQHSGQHLLSAIMETEFDIETLSWNLGSSLSFVEIPRKPTAEELEMIQRRCNEVIRSLMPVNITCTKDILSNLPKDYDATSGVVRIISIGDIDRNQCCGTHVNNTGYLQQIVLLHLSPVRGTNFRLHFVVGDRAARLLGQLYSSLRTISSNLSCGMDEVEEKVQHNLQVTRELQQKEKCWKLVVAANDADRIQRTLELKGRAYLYRPDADLDLLTNISRQLGQSICGLVVMFSGEQNNGGSIIIIGDPIKVEDMVTQISILLKNVKGGGKGAKWQGKVSKWEKGEIEMLHKLLES